VAIAAGAVKVIATDGAGSGAAVVDTLDGLEGSLSTLTVTGALTANGGIDVTGLATASEMTVSDTDDIRLRFLNGTTFKAGLQVVTSTGDMITGSAVDDLAIRSQANMLFSTNGNTERMRLNADGQLSLATTENKARMTVGLTGVAITGDTDGATMGENAIFHLENSNAGAANSTVMLLGGGAGAVGQIKSGIGFTRESASNWGTQLRFYTHSTSTSDLDELNEAMRIDSAGKLMQGVTTAGGFFHQDNPGNIVTHQINTPNGYTKPVIQSSSISAAATNWFHFVGQVGNGSAVTANSVFIFGNGNIQNTNNSYGAFSDVKLKENIVDSGSQWEDIKAVRVRKYSMIADNESSPNRLGVIAQELESSGMSGLVLDNTDRDENYEELETTTKSVQYSVLYMKAIKALQEAMTRIETLEAKVQTLENN
jgi:hypothetical protein